MESEEEDGAEGDNLESDPAEMIEHDVFLQKKGDDNEAKENEAEEERQHEEEYDDDMEEALSPQHTAAASAANADASKSLPLHLQESICFRIDLKAKENESPEQEEAEKVEKAIARMRKELCGEIERTHLLCLLAHSFLRSR